MKLKEILIVMGIFFLVNVHLAAQEVGINNVVGTNHFIDSKTLGTTRQVQIYLPSDYAETDKDYPVLYLLDGQQFFPYGVSLYESFRQFNLTPEFIIVGINNSYPQRYNYFSNDRDQFIGFMELELLPYIEANFRTKDEKLLFGWQYAGSLGFHILINNSSLFDAYFLASPYPIKDEIDALENVSIANKAVYFSVSPDEYEVNHGTDKLDSLLSLKKISGLDWSYLRLESEEHHSTAYPTLYHSLRKYFKYYPEFQEDNLQKFIDAGGLDYALAYAKERGRKYGFSSELSSWSKYTIIRSAIRANNYHYFESFANEFVSDEFISEISNRAYDIAVFYNENKNYNKAIELFNVLLRKNPESVKLLNDLGNAHLALGNNNEAEKYYQQAKALSKSNK